MNEGSALTLRLFFVLVDKSDDFNGLQLQEVGEFGDENCQYTTKVEAR